MNAPDAGANYPGGTGVVAIKSTSVGTSISGYTSSTTYTFAGIIILFQNRDVNYVQWGAFPT